MDSYAKDPGMKILVPFSLPNRTLCCGQPGFLCHSSLILSVGHLGDLSKKTQNIHTHTRAVETSVYSVGMSFSHLSTHFPWISCVKL